MGTVTLSQETGEMVPGFTFFLFLPAPLAFSN
jgi:hypothetical protein